MSGQLSEPRNRFVQVVNSTTLNGIDFVELPAVDATTLFVHFLNTVPLKGQGPYTATITGGDRIPTIGVAAIIDANWSVDAEGRPLLTLQAAQAGDFSNYTLTISGGPIDLMFNSTIFSFKALCPSDFDCEPTTPYCPPDTTPIPPIDYLAKDFQSFQRALTDFSALRYPAWQERAEADFGMMFMEALCATADELSYLQDRVAAEATLQTATQRRSFVSMARLVDYEPLPALSATTIIQCNVLQGPIAAGLVINAKAPDGTLVPFEIGTGLNDTSSYVVSRLWNDGIQPYWFDDSQRCLPRGSTSMWVLGHGFGFTSVPNLALLIQTDLPGESIREQVHVVAAYKTSDPIFLQNGQPTKVTQISWDSSEALQRDHDLTVTHLAGNLLPATQGRRQQQSYAIGSAPAGTSGLAVAIARRGPNGTDAQPNWIFRAPLTQGRLAWLPPAGAAPDPSLNTPSPEILVTQAQPQTQPWSFATTLLDATALEPAFTVDPMAWRVVAADAQGNPTQWDYDGDQGDTVRFGDNVFGLQPADGSVFQIRYRVGLGAEGNVAPDAINLVDPSWVAYVSSARNPFIVTNGADAETAQHIQRMAPQAFQAVQYRAVRPEDYAAAAETLPWVLKAGTAFRWTGSWLSVFTTVDPTGSEAASTPDQSELIDLLNRRRLAGYESYAPQPDLVAIDLQITVCALAGWLSSDVEQGVLNRLGNAMRPDGSSGFFFADRFTFGTPLYRSRLEAAIQGVAGVSGVLLVQYRRRGATATFLDLPEVLPLGSSEILRVDNNPDYPERGTIRVFVEGGR